jgi:hypothetical protein
MVIRLDLEIGQIGKSGSKRIGRKGVGVQGKKYCGYWVLGAFCLFGCISDFVVEDAFVRDCRGLGLCIVGIVD